MTTTPVAQDEANAVPSVLGPIAQVSLREAARRAIRAGVITGEIEAGEIYSAPSLATRLGVSATPVREALLDLANEGLVELVKNRGFRVVVLDDTDLAEISELRMLLEVPAAGKAAGKLGSQQSAKLERLVEQLERTAEAGDLVGYLTADNEFHNGLIEPLGNKRLEVLVAQLRDQQRLYGLPRILHTPAFLETSLEHREILDAVVAGDAGRAEALMRKHLSHTRGIWAGDGRPTTTAADPRA